MKTVLVTGAKGFIGKNLVQTLLLKENVHVLQADIETSESELEAFLQQAETIVHLAGVNRPKDVSEFQSGNLGYTSRITSILKRLKKSVRFICTSSIQAELDNPYGVSKREMETELRRFAKSTSSDLRIFRLTNVFGKWCRPFYNSVVATFCHQVAHKQELRIDDPERVLELGYIDDVVRHLLTHIFDETPRSIEGFISVEPAYPISLKALAETLSSFPAIRQTGVLPDFSDTLTKYLYTTWLSYLEPEDFAYPLDKKSDQRGWLCECIKAPSAGQIFVSKTKPGITRGNHWHHTKTEKFLVLEGTASINFRNINTQETQSFIVRGEDCRVVDIPPGWTHNITNTGEGDLITLFWANEIFNPEQPDTYFCEV